MSSKNIIHRDCPFPMSSKNIIHRDLKPANVFLDEYLFPKIGDFGLSKEVDDESTLSYDSSHYVGSPAFMAPEIFNEYNYNKASDVYAFGLLVYQMITLEEPFKDYNYFKLMIDVVSGIRPTLESNIPNCYKNLIENCWCDDAKDRPTFENIVHLLENDSEFISETVDKNEYFDYIQYIKDIKKKGEFHPVTIDFEKLKKMQQNDSRINISFLDLKRYTKHKFVKKTDNFKIYEIKNKYTGEIYEAKISNFNIEYLGKNEIIHLSREINTLSKLNHPSFIKFIGYSPVDFNQQTNPVIVTEKPPNKSLRNLLDNKEYNEGWDDTKKLIVIFGISSGMKYLHSNNIIHRNLCPESIFLDEYLFPKIGNYGLLTKLHSTKSMTYQTSIGIKGNILYSSPELLAQNEYSKSSDVYAFSLIIYEIITNKKPFKNISNCNDLYNEIVNKSNRPKINSNINEHYRKLIESCWCQKAEDRHTFELITSILKNCLKQI